MADIDIVQKNTSRTWVWVVVVLALIALAFWFFNRQPTRTTRADRVGAPYAANHPAPAALTTVDRFAS